MPKVASESVRIDKLWSGESGTAPWQRRAGQVSEATNVRFDIGIGGAVKRGPTILINDLDGDSANNPFDDTQPYYFVAIRGAIVALGNGTVHGWDRDGIPLHVIDETAGGLYEYIATNPQTNLDACVSFDTIIVVNRRTTITIGIGWTFQQSMNFIINGDHTDDTGAPAVGGNWDGTVDTFDDLPNDAENGDVYRVRFDYQFDPGGYFLYWDGAIHDDAEGYFPDHGSWFRVVRHQQRKARYDDTRMPHRIIYDEDDGTLTLSTCPWQQRISGSPDTNRHLPLVGHEITSVEFHSGRLFLIGQLSICSSRHNDFFNPWVDNVNAVNDEDRISTDITESRIGKILHTAVCGPSLLIIAENAQLEFHSGSDPLSNANGRIKQVGSLQAQNIEPAVGPNEVIIVDGFGDIHRFSYSSPDFGVVHSEVLTIHRRKLLHHKTVLRLILIESALFVCLLNQPMLVHDSFGVKGELIQSAWGEFRMQNRPVFIDAWADEIRIVTHRYEEGGHSLLSYIHREQAAPEPMLYMPRMDRMELIDPDDMEYDSSTNTTTLRHTGRDGEKDRSCVVLRSDETGNQMVHLFLRPTEIDTAGHPVFSGDLTDTEQWLGFTFDTELVLTKLYPGLTSMGLTMQRVVVFHYESTDYEIVGRRENGPRQGPHGWQAQRVQLSNIGVAPFETHFKEFNTIQGDPRQIEISLSSSSPGQCAWLGIEYEVTLSGRGTSG